LIATKDSFEWFALDRKASGLERRASSHVVLTKGVSGSTSS
jgi:hypothetical protein